MNTPKCPMCGAIGSVVPGGFYKCPKGHGFFDDKPDEGGTHSNRNPAVRLERQERWDQQQKERRIRRRF